MKPSLGTVSSGTLDTEELIEAFEDTLAYYHETLPERDAEMNDEEYLESLFEALNLIAPSYCYFGALEGDGADFGFWIDWDSLRDDEDVLRVSDTSEVPDTYTGDVLHVNDHGNATLYHANCGELTEIWACV